MAHQVHVISESMSSSECDSFRSPSLSFVVVGDGTVRQDPDADVREDADLMLIQDLTERVGEMSEALAQSQNQETSFSYKNSDEEKEHFRRRIQKLEEEKVALELTMREQILALERQVEESKNTSMMTSMSASTCPEALGTMVEQLTIQNSELRKQLEGASSSSKMVAVVKMKTKELNAKDETIAILHKEKGELESLLQEEQENASNERMRLLQQIEELSKAKRAPNNNLSSELRAKEEELERKEQQIAQLQEEKDDVEKLLQEELENASKKEEQMQARIIELEKAKKRSPPGTLQTSGDLQAKEEELKRKEESISALQKEKEDLESLLLEEQENMSQQKEELEARIAALMKDAPSDNDQRCASLQQQIAEMKKVYEDQLADLRTNHEVDAASLRQQLADMKKHHETEITNLRKSDEHTAPVRQEIDEITKRHEEEMTTLRKNHDDAMKEQQARAKTEINQLKRELSLLKRNVTPEGAANSDELDELRGLNQRLENKLRDCEISNNKLSKKKGELLTEMRGLRSEKAKLEAELVILQRQMTDMQMTDRSSSDETERLRERAAKLENECDDHQQTIRYLQDALKNLRAANQENRGSPNRSSKDADEYNQNLMQIYNFLSKTLNTVARRKEERSEKKSGRALLDSILRLSDMVARTSQEQNDLLELALKEKEFEKGKRREAEAKLAEGKIHASQQLKRACDDAKQELAAQFAEHAGHQRQFIDFLQTRLELVTSPFFQQRMQPVPAYNGCSHFVGQPLPQP